MKSCVFGVSTNSLTGINEFLEHKFDFVFKVVVNKFILLVDKIKQFNDNFKDEVKFMFKKFVNAGKRICAHRKNAALHNTLKKLSDNSRIKVCKFDK